LYKIILIRSQVFYWIIITIPLDRYFFLANPNKKKTPVTHMIWTAW